MMASITDKDIASYLPAPTSYMTSADAVAARTGARTAAAPPPAADTAPTDEELAARLEAGVIGTPESSARSRLQMGARYAARDAAIREASKRQTPPPSFYGGDAPEERTTRDALAWADAEDRAAATEERARAARPWWQPPPLSLRDEGGHLPFSPLTALGKVGSWLETADPTGTAEFAGRFAHNVGTAFGILPAVAEQLASAKNPFQPLGEYVASGGEHAGEEASKNFRETIKRNWIGAGLPKTTASGMADVLEGATALFGNAISPGEVLSIFRAVPEMTKAVGVAARLGAEAEGTQGLRQAALAAAEEARTTRSYAAFEDLAKEAEKFEARAKGPAVEAAREEAGAAPTLRPLEPRHLAPQDPFAPEPGPPIEMGPSGAPFTPVPEPQRMLPRGPLVAPYPPSEPAVSARPGPLPGGAAFFPEGATAESAARVAPRERTPEDVAFFESLGTKGPIPPPAGAPPGPPPAPGARPVGGFTSAQARRFVSDLLDTTIRENRDPTQAARAFYRTHAKDIVARDPNDFGPIAHEAMHRIEDVLGGSLYGRLTGSPWAKYADELDPIAHSVYGTTDAKGLAAAIGPNSSPTSEGAAEFMRHYLTDAKLAKTLAPKFFDDMPGLLRRADPRIADGIGRLQAEIAVHSAKTDVEKMAANILVADPHPMPSDLSPAQRIVNSVMDGAVALRKVRADVEAAGGKLPAGFDPAMAQEALRNMTGMESHWARTGVTSYWNPAKIVGPSTEAVMRGFPDLEVGGVYMTAQRELGAYAAREESIEAAIAAGKEPPPSLRLPDLFGDAKGASQKELLARYRQVVADTEAKVGNGPKMQKTRSDARVNYYSDAGFLSKKGATQWKDPAGDAIYFPLARSMEEAGTFPTESAWGGGQYKRYSGESGREILNPWTQMQRNDRAMLQQVGTNNIRLGLVEAARRTPGLPGVTIMPSQFSEATVGGMVAKRAAAAGLTVPEYARSLGVDESALNEMVGTAIGPEKAPGGRFVHYAFNREGVSGRRPIPELARDIIAIEVSPELHAAIMPPSEGLGTKIAAFPADVYRAGVVHTPTFSFFSHLPSDTLQSMVFSRTQRTPFVDAVVHAIRGAGGVLTEDEVYRALKATGGLRGDLTGAAEGMRGLLSDLDVSPRGPGKFRALSRFVFQKIPEMGFNAVRVGEAQAAMRGLGLTDLSAMTRDQAAEWANLARYAATNPSVVGAHMHFLSRVSPFLNVGIQGGRQLFLSLRDNPVRASAGLASLIGAELAHWYIARNSQTEIDLTPEQRRRAWRIGDVQLTKPKGYIGAIMKSASDVMDYATGRRPNALRELADNYAAVFDESIPILSNPGAKLPFEMMTGTRLDQPLERMVMGEAPVSIVPKREQGLKPYAQTDESQGTAQNAIGRMFDVSPRKINRAIQDVFGTVGTESWKFGNLATDLFRPAGPAQPSQGWQAIPGVGRVVPPWPPARTAPEDWVYETFADVNRNLATARLEQRPPDPGDLALAARLKNAVTVMGALQKRAAVVRADPRMTGDAKRVALDDLYVQMANAARRQYGR